MALPTPASQAASPLLYFEIDPPADLAHIVLSFWGFEVRDGTPHSHTLWPDASLSFTWGTHRDHTTVLGAMGARTEPIAVPIAPGDEFRGIRLWPDVTRALCNIDPHSVRDRRLPLASCGEFGKRLADAIGGGASIRNAFALFEDAIRTTITSRAEPDRIVRQAIRAIDAAPDEAIGKISQQLSLSERQLRRRFGEATGLSPKEYARIRRLRRMLARVLNGGERWSTIAARAGFSDQPHLINEIVRMTAYTPRQLEERLRLIEHVGVKP